MTKMTRSLFAAAFFVLALAGSRAWAQTCSADTDCPQSYACLVSGTSTAPACKGTDCPTDAGASQPVVYKACEPKMCATDADCGTGMICYEQKSTACSGSGGSASGCAPNTKCDAGAVITTVETCTTTTSKLCAFKWQVPCSADSDCGDGFVCQPNVSGGCGTSSHTVSSGPSGSTGGASGGDSAFPPAADAGGPNCSTVTSFPGSCTPKATTCVGDGECPGGWTCTAIGTPQPVTGVGIPTPAGGVATAVAPADSVDAGASMTKICIGPFGAGAPTRGIDVGTGEATNAGHQGTDAAPPPAAAGGGAKGGATGGTTGGANASSGSSGSGCAIAAARSGASPFLAIGVAAVGLALARRRRRRE